MSTLKADTIVASDGTSPVTLTKQSAAKAFSYATYSSGTPQDINSFNISSLGDHSTGIIDHNFTNSMSNANHSCGTSNRNWNLSHVRSPETSTSKVRTSTYDSADQDHNRSVNVFGDLA